MSLNNDTQQKLRLVLVTGLSGAGRTSALRALEDLGFDAVDNLPISLLAALVAGAKGETADPLHREKTPLAVGIDIRSRDFGTVAFQEELDRLIIVDGLDVDMVFVDCDDDNLIRRFKETRRRHPLAIDRPVADGLRIERQMMSPLRERANYIIDSSNLTIWQMKARIGEIFASSGQGNDQIPSTRMRIMMQSFSFRKGIPREADVVFDVRFLDNPHYVPELRDLTGRDEAVGEYIASDVDFSRFFSQLTGLLEITFPRYEREGKSYLTVAIGCTGGQHRSVYLVKCLAAWAEQAGWNVLRHHRELDTGRDSLAK